MPKAKKVQTNRICFTVNNYSLAELRDLTLHFDKCSNAIAYGIIGQEIGEKGTRHLQGFVGFKSGFLHARDGILSFWKTTPGLGRAHIEAALGTNEDQQR